MNIWELDKLVIFIAFVIPGFISIRVYELLHPSELLESSKKLIEAVTYSCMNYALAFAPIYFIETSDLKASNPVVYGFFYVFILFIEPILVAYCYSIIRQTNWLQDNAPHPVKMPWDFVFKQRQWYWVIIELKGGGKIAGKYAGKSFSSSYPAPQQIYLEERWVLDEDDSFTRVRSGSAGVLISSDEISNIEFFVYNKGDNDE
ncbi:hypothetical protein J4H56_02005 [Vibrio alginolyticus]|uniref:DUF6338 family protein n=1 Tax=Vibrio harveyi group TaxID=717610 RepID=UPI0004722C12|nr:MULTISPECIES: DUF6338 family protein [Vibrio harveyi group]MBS9881361.1 hypothetical protein [Vibrio alginolyticus]HAS6885137.1 hypothetical protein [Vibrio parahaemolyticus]